MVANKKYWQELVQGIIPWQLRRSSKLNSTEEAAIYIIQQRYALEKVQEGVANCRGRQHRFE